MSVMKVNNEVIIEKAKRMMMMIQLERHKNEFKAIKNIEVDFNSLNMNWVFTRNFKEWFKYFGPFALLGFIGYPFSVINRLYIVKHMPENASVFEKAEYLDKIEKDFFLIHTEALESFKYEEQYKSCKKLKCMAKNNEFSHMEISREEAEDLGIC